MKRSAPVKRPATAEPWTNKLMAETAARAAGHAGDQETRRDFLYLLTGATTVVGAAVMVWPLIDAMNPSADVLALASTEVDLSGIEPGMAITVKWRGKPVFIRHRTEAEIEQAEAVSLADLPDPEPDTERVIEPQWLVLVGVCTHLGCVPLGQRAGDPRGDYGGWFCPCHGSHYDQSGRIRRGPAPRNLVVPEYAFIDESVIRIG
jgi:ubiquinol-cytochrome c reductase iron-sulfur subunit